MKAGGTATARIGPGVALVLAACFGSDLPERPAVPSAGSAGVETATQATPAGSTSLPARLDPPGWLLQEPAIVVPAQRMRDHLAGAAEHLVTYGVQELTAGRYADPGSANWARVEVFRFVEPLNAFGAYSTRRLAVQESVEIENEAFAGPKSVHVWRGNHYIRLFGEDRKSLEAIARTIAATLPPAPSLPEPFALLPGSYRLVRSETWRIDSGFGQSCFARSFTARYLLPGNQPAEALIVVAGTPREAAEIINRFRGFFFRGGRLYDPLPNLGEESFRAEERSFGRTVAFRIDRFVVATRGYGVADGLIAMARESAATITAFLEAQAKAPAESSPTSLTSPTSPTSPTGLIP